ncbi:MAG TPA: response regulator [Candidatus Binatia bacterium]|jgi:CheY-like chemotaxis protein|nr:response regulator [Candidatus Binatia bacterium]
MKKILIIEDDQIVANIYRNKFSVEGYDVITAADGEAGLESLRSFRPDAIVLDLLLPKISGVDLMKKIRAEPEFQQVPIIVFSNTYLTNMVQEAWKAGATKCLSKANCTPKQLIDVVRSTLSKNGASPAAVPSGHTPAPVPRAASSPAVAPHPHPLATNPEAEPQNELGKMFLAGLPPILSTLRTLLQTLSKADDEPTRLKALNEIYRSIHSLTANAGMAGLGQIAHLSDALEALLLELYQKPATINVSTLRTVASAIDLLGLLRTRGPRPHQKEPASPSILVVDDEPISRRAVTCALEKAGLKSVSLEDPQLAFNLLAERKFDLVFLDIDMPNMKGFELCAKLRNLPGYGKTPVVFVTGLTDFESRANSTMSGGNDFIAKPFLLIELAVKALIHLLRVQLEPAR